MASKIMAQAGRPLKVAWQRACDHLRVAQTALDTVADLLEKEEEWGIAGSVKALGRASLNIAHEVAALEKKAEVASLEVNVKKKNKVMKFFTPDGRKVFVRHIRNDRDQDWCTCA